MTDLSNQLTFRQQALELCSNNQGKLEVAEKIKIRNVQELSLAYTPGVAVVANEIAAEPKKAYDLTMKGNFVAVVTDGSAILGLGDLGPLPALPVVEGKALCIKAFAGLNAIPLCLETDDVEQFIQTVKSFACTFGAIQLEDITAPRCFEIEQRLKEELSIPVFHDDQHGTAVVTAAGLVNALKVVGKELSNIKVVINGAGAAGVAIAKLLKQLNVKDIVVCDSKGAIFDGRETGMNKFKQELTSFTNRDKVTTLEEAMHGADVFVGVSQADLLTTEMIQSMNKDAIVFALANPDPEIKPEKAIEAGARIVATGRYDYPNQINNLLAFPGILKGALEARAEQITQEMIQASVFAIANLVDSSVLDENLIVPDPFETDVASAVASAVKTVVNENN